MRTLSMFAVSLCLAALPAAAESGGNPLSAANKGFYGQLKDYVLRSAEKVPEEHYSFKPTPEVRSFAQLFGHLADDNYVFCSVVLGEKNPVSGIEKSKTSKAELSQALKESFAYCDKAYDQMTDQSAAEIVKFFNHDLPKLSVLSINNAHIDEHYGNLATYMRLKNIVPPSSEKGQ